MMNYLNYLWVGQLVIALTVGFFLVRQIKDIILAIIIRLLPLRYRISSDSATLHARVSTIVSFVLVFLIGGTTYWGLGKAVGWVTVTEQTMVNIPPSPSIFRPAVPKPKPQKLPYSPIPAEEPESVKEVPVKIVPTVLKTPPPKPRVVPIRQVETYDHIPIVAQPSYYLQMSTARTLAKARTSCDRLRSKWNIPCKIGVDETQVPSYKILLGGFASRADANAFKRKYRLKKPFPRAKSFFDYIIEE